MSDIIEDLALKAADGDASAVTALNDTLKELVELDEKSNTALIETAELIFDDATSASANEQKVALALDMARLNVESLAIRDTIATVARAKYSEYLDPAGLIRSIAVLNTDISLAEVHVRFQLFAYINENEHVWHDSFGMGIIKEIDAFSDIIKVHFKTPQTFSLEQALQNLSAVIPGSLVDLLIKKESSFTKSQDAKEFEISISQSFSPQLKSAIKIIESLLVPEHLGPKELINWLDKEGKAKKTVPTTNETTTDATTPGPNDPITWENARSLQELKVHISDEKSIDFTDEHVAHFLKLYTFASQREKSSADFAETMSMLMLLAKDKEKVIGLVKALPESVIWTDSELYRSSIIKLPGKYSEPWFTASYHAKERDAFITDSSLLPMKYYAHMEKAVINDEFSIEQLIDMIVTLYKNRQVGPDGLLWLWKQGTENSVEAISNPRRLFKVLSKEAVGEYIKSRKTLFQLLMDDVEFQKVMMEGGSNEGIATFVKIVKNMKLLDKGEQQSLLVKIVRQFPEARAHVEEKKAPTLKKDSPKISSIASVEARQKELQDIINKRIPENSNAISEARSHGDLRENFEFKAAKEQQRFLMARRGELEGGLNIITAMDFSAIEPDDLVIPGSTVDLSIDGKPQTYHICGLWDSNPDIDILSYDTPIGQALLGSEVGDAVDIPAGTATVNAIKKLPEEIVQWLEKPRLLETE